MKFGRIIVYNKDFEIWFGVCSKKAASLMQDYREWSNLRTNQPLTIFHIYEDLGVDLEFAPLIMIK